MRNAWRKASASAGARSQRYNPGSTPLTRCTNKTRCQRYGGDCAESVVGRITHEPPNYHKLLNPATPGLPADAASVTRLAVDRAQSARGRPGGPTSAWQCPTWVWHWYERRDVEGGFRGEICRAGDRATEFKQRCVGLRISGVSLHSYRYAWAERALKCGFAERFAQQALGHNSKAVHRAYAKHAEVTVPSQDDWEKDWREKPQRNGQPKLAMDSRSPLAAVAQSN